MATKRTIVKRGRLGYVERIENDGDPAWFVQCSNRMFKRRCDSEAEAIAYLADVDAGLAEPPL